ncbi:hypothetical protein [Bradyrhizobium sp. USDA 4504]
MDAAVEQHGDRFMMADACAGALETSSAHEEPVTQMIPALKVQLEIRTVARAA